MEKDLEERTKLFALAVLRFCPSLPRDRAVDILARQLIRSATSIGANYREANRAVSRAAFRNKIGTVQKEAAETQYWIELLIEGGFAKPEPATNVYDECTQLLAIFTAIGKKLRPDEGESGK